jgi:hypothetical protein
MVLRKTNISSSSVFFSCCSSLPSGKNEIGYAASPAGIHWEKYHGNSVYGPKDDPFIANNPESKIMEFPSLVFTDSLCLMYYDYGQVINSIGVATARH